MSLFMVTILADIRGVRGSNLGHKTGTVLSSFNLVPTQTLSFMSLTNFYKIYYNSVNK
jgi:hypothetical protein